MANLAMDPNIQLYLLLVVTDNSGKANSSDSQTLIKSIIRFVLFLWDPAESKHIA